MLLDRRLCVAPMMEWTDRHCRYLLRLISPSALLYTEMVTTGALLHGEPRRFLAFNVEEHPVALQLGGSDPTALARCARMAEDAGYDEVNLNVGCPSDRVQSGRFGACLMLEPSLVADCVAAMSAAVSIPVTVKHRTGVDEHDSYEGLTDFVKTVHAAGCGVFIVHARKAWLSGLSPKENREVPPLNYETVYRLKADQPGLELVINGGIKRLDEVSEHLRHCDGVMIGREAYHNPWFLDGVERLLGMPSAGSRREIAHRFIDYAGRELERGQALKHLTRHVLGLFQGQPGARAWRRYLSENAHRDGAGVEVLEEALKRVP
ncbi:MAG: tRNA dihydrouridine(20/20a) synthase DusA [Gammaproteobacteria bacterium]